MSIFLRRLTTESVRSPKKSEPDRRSAVATKIAIGAEIEVMTPNCPDLWRESSDSKLKMKISESVNTPTMNKLMTLFKVEISMAYVFEQEELSLLLVFVPEFFRQVALSRDLPIPSQVDISDNSVIKVNYSLAIAFFMVIYTDS